MLAVNADIPATAAVAIGIARTGAPYPKSGVMTISTCADVNDELVWRPATLYCAVQQPFRSSDVGL
jgi:hypothetical protein